MTDNERALLLFVAERLQMQLASHAPELPEYGWDGRDPGPEWNEIYRLNELICNVRGGSAAFAASVHPDDIVDGARKVAK